jgi:hypothetical protein
MCDVIGEIVVLTPNPLKRGFSNAQPNPVNPPFQGGKGGKKKYLGDKTNICRRYNRVVLTPNPYNKVVLTPNPLKRGFSNAQPNPVNPPFQGGKGGWKK